jgi:hypothetical protein
MERPSPRSRPGSLQCDVGMDRQTTGPYFGGFKECCHINRLSPCREVWITQGTVEHSNYTATDGGLMTSDMMVPKL